MNNKENRVIKPSWLTASTCFHGSTKPIPNVQLGYTRGAVDFGHGFYTTSYYHQAVTWATFGGSRRGYVSAYGLNVPLNQLPWLKVKIFTLDEDWFDFVMSNRLKGGKQHAYDIVAGPLADNNMRDIFLAFEKEKITKREALERLNYSTWGAGNQISFHTNESLKILQYKGAEQC